MSLINCFITIACLLSLKEILNITYTGHRSKMVHKSIYLRQWQSLLVTLLMQFHCLEFSSPAVQGNKLTIKIQAETAILCKSVTTLLWTIQISLTNGRFSNSLRMLQFLLRRLSKTFQFLNVFMFVQKSISVQTINIRILKYWLWIQEWNGVLKLENTVRHLSRFTSYLVASKRR